MKLGIGMRNIKTGLAVFVCVIISRLLKLEYPFILLLLCSNCNAKLRRSIL